MNRDEIISSLKSFKDLNQDKYSIQKIGLFGSAARDEMSERSDIDVVVELKKQDLFDLIGIKQDLEDQFHCQVDIVSYRDKMNKFLKRRIDKESIYV